MRKRAKQVSFNTMVKFFIKQYNIPTRKDVDKLMARIDRLEKLIRAMDSGRGRRVAATDSARGGGRGKSVVTATMMVLDVIRSNKDGVGFSDIQASTGFEDKKIRNIIYRLDKIGKITRKSRGIYTAL